ncbi:putative transcription factor bHLH041 [Cajanus cajan]|uniref:putative transcription factor bHLH041 n=1 Tax=Cajanus cajan TaxID=3821 RepID=UPI00098DAE42|nr:putative transcription factor bHLH041 [Cajanus cajan]
MDGVFSLTEAVRAEFLCSLVHSFGCTYVSLWQYDSNLSNRLFFLDGFYDVMNNQLRSSLGNVAESLFHQYQTLTFHVHDGCVPGVAFTNHIPYLELQRSDLLRLTSNEIQAQFFQEARIEGSEWEEPGFEEAVRRVVADVIQWQLDQSRTQNTDK